METSPYHGKKVDEAQIERERLACFGSSNERAGEVDPAADTTMVIQPDDAQSQEWVLPNAQGRSRSPPEQRGRSETPKPR